ncbi:unnamed protein product [Lactuca saligna]|uniref:Uncharacterized protein n=1 Tax=Lactuca saligna TaxID=75948 RepID=A0AA35VDU2_LACSI|nr:unnamed protein product [Lactuca saligna]
MLLSIFDPQLMAINDPEHREEEEVAAADDEDTAAFDFHANRRSQILFIISTGQKSRLASSSVGNATNDPPLAHPMLTVDPSYFCYFIHELQEEE